MNLQRRRMLQCSALALSAPLLGGCDGDKPVVSIDPRLPIGPFGKDSTAEEVTAGMDLSGKTALVTGCNSGLGYETMRVLALRGAHVSVPVALWKKPKLPAPVLRVRPRRWLWNYPISNQRGTAPRR